MASLNWSGVKRRGIGSIGPHGEAHHHGVSVFDSREQWVEWVKAYYRETETYDWVDVADNVRGPEAFFHRYRARVVRKLLEKYLPGVPILDAGCGTGLNLRSLPSDSIGLDINPRNLEVVNTRYPKYETVLADIEDMPFGDGEFDGVLCTEVVEHVPNPDVALREIFRVLRPGGVLIGSVPSLSPVWKLRFVSRTCEASEPFHNQYRVESVMAMLSDFDKVLTRHSVLGTSVVFVARKVKDA